MKNVIWKMTIVLAVIPIFIIGCGKSEFFGEPFSGDAPKTTIKQMLENPADYVDKTVLIEGKIKEVCPAGCWFFANDDFGELYVNIGPAGFAIPNKMGHKVKIEGEIINHKGTMMLMGKGVEIK